MATPVRVVSVERSLFEGEVDGQGRPFLVCLGAEGELGILPRHAPLLTSLRPGAMYIRNGSDETELFVGGGFLEVLPDRVTVLADVAEGKMHQRCIHDLDSLVEVSGTDQGESQLESSLGLLGE